VTTIFLLGGTSETREIALSLAQAGYDVLVSTATDIDLDVGKHPRVRRRSGRLDRESMRREIITANASAIVDATHPYAVEVSALAADLASKLGLRRFEYARPSASTAREGITLAADHEEAAAVACRLGRPVLLTIGSKNLGSYARQAKLCGAEIFARVLAEKRSVEACLSLGLDREHIITGRGPFSTEENRETIRKFNIGVLVTKDSGAAGGVTEKLEAARMEGCRVVMIMRPEQEGGTRFSSVQKLIEAITRQIPLLPPFVKRGDGGDFGAS
jgi:precorrin-6A/cobalt-precorrin-6A reductase